MKKRILVIDDEASITQWISMVLTSTDRYEVDSVNDPLEARDRAATTKYDLLISDVRMPKMTGDYLYCCLDTDPDTGMKTIRRPKLLLMSGAMDEEGLGKKRQSIGASSHLKKPFRPEQLLSTVDSLLKEE